MHTDEDVDTNAFTQNPRMAPAVMEPLTFTPARASPGTVAIAPYAQPHPSAGPGARYPPPGLRMASRTLLCSVPSQKTRQEVPLTTKLPPPCLQFATHFLSLHAFPVGFRTKFYCFCAYGRRVFMH